MLNVFRKRESVSLVLEAQQYKIGGAAQERLHQSYIITFKKRLF